jgi:uncharacterized protein
MSSREPVQATARAPAASDDAPPVAPGQLLQWLAAAGVGVLFGFGLLLSGMANPAKVQAFLDLAGPWDPSLALVMGGAIAVALPVYAWTRRRRHSLWGHPLPASPSQQLDGRLVGGSLLFGAGWGLAGYCPGPALVSLGLGWGPAWWLVAGMLAGMALHAGLEARRAGDASGG